MLFFCFVYYNRSTDSWSSSSGFDQQIDSSRARAAAAIKRLPGISATIQQAVNNNGETLSVLGDVSDDYSNALGTINRLENLVNSLEVRTNSSNARLTNRKHGVAGASEGFLNEIISSQHPLTRFFWNFQPTWVGFQDDQQNKDLVSFISSTSQLHFLLLLFLQWDLVWTPVSSKLRDGCFQHSI